MLKMPEVEWESGTVDVVEQAVNELLVENTSLSLGNDGKGWV